MSIIYDALKKVEKSNSVNPKAEDKKNSSSGGPKIKIFLVYGLAVCLGVVIASMLFGVFIKPIDKLKITKAKKTEKTGPALVVISPPVVQQPKPKPVENVNVPIPSSPAENKPRSEFPPMMINGVFFSQSEGYALINNQIVKEGDTVNGVLVKRIGLDEIEFEFDGLTKRISTK